MCEEIKSALIKYLRDAGLYTTDDECVWEIVKLPTYGRCLMAKRDIQVNELICCDKPLLTGPRVHNYEKVI